MLVVLYSIGLPSQDHHILFTTIKSALNAVGTDTGTTRGTYGEPTSNTDIHIHDQFAIYIEHGFIIKQLQHRHIDLFN